MKKSILFLSFFMTCHSVFAVIGGEKAVGTENNGIFQIGIPGSSDDNDAACTASKIGKNLILTAAHCFDDNENARIVALNTLVSTDGELQYDGLSIKNYIIHPSYDPKQEDEDFGAKTYDVAIIEIEPSKIFDALPAIKMDFGNVSTGENVEFWGYGCQKNVDASEDYKPVKKVSRSSTLDKNSLLGDFGFYTKRILKTKNDIYKNMILTPGGDLNKSMASVCAGDSGGPVLRNGKIVGINNTYIGWGSTEEGHTKSGKTYINLHTRIETIKSWVLEKTLNK
jgi:secreted trypsin-like serine protease